MISIKQNDHDNANKYLPRCHATLQSCVDNDFSFTGNMQQIYDNLNQMIDNNTGADDETE